MTEKLAIATLVTGAEWEQIAEFTFPTLRRYAARLGAEFVVMKKRVYSHPHYDKWQLYDLLTQYDRIIYMDADIIVRPDCPDLFVQVPPEWVGGENELSSFPDQAQYLARFCQRLGIALTHCPFYVNGGLFVVSSCHRELFRPPETVLTDIVWPEQNHFNARLITEHHKLCLLPPTFNDRLRSGHYLRCSYVLHYSCMTHPARIHAIRQDLAEWDRLYSRPNSMRIGEPRTNDKIPMDAWNPYQAVMEFENSVASYAGSQHAVAVDSCTIALFLCCKYVGVDQGTTILPTKTYCSVANAVIHAGGRITFEDYDWHGEYELKPWKIVDSALRFRRGMYEPRTLRCLSFQFRKHIPIGRGGMILTDDDKAAHWFRLARFNGRPAVPLGQGGPEMIGWLAYMEPERASRGLTFMMNVKDDYPDLSIDYPDLSSMSLYQPHIATNGKPLLYVITPVLRIENLTRIGENLKAACEHWDVRWLPIFDSRKGNDGCEKRNAALQMIRDPGWVYHLDDDNLLHPNFGAALLKAIAQYPETKVFLFKQIRASGSPYIIDPTITPYRIDTGSYAVHSSAIRGSFWSMTEMPTPDYHWIRRICGNGFKPQLIDALCYYNALAKE